MRLMALSWILCTVSVMALPSCATTTATAQPAASAQTLTYNHDMSAYRKLGESTLTLIHDGKMAEANDQILRLEKTWDTGTSDFKWASFSVYKPIDIQLDVAIDACDAKNSAKAITELETFLAMLAKVPAN